MSEIAKKHLTRRYRAERRFRLLGRLAILFALSDLALLLGGILITGVGAFSTTLIELPVHFADIDPAHPEEADYQGMAKKALQSLFPENIQREDKKALNAFLSSDAGDRLAQAVRETPSRIGTLENIRLLADDRVDQWRKGNESGAFSEKQIHWLEQLRQQGRLKIAFNSLFFTGGDSREPEQAGILGAFLGSFWTVLIAMGIALPFGVMAALYLEEFAPKNRVTDWIEVNINNLAAVPSIVFGLLGLAVFLNLFGIPRSSPLAGGMVLSLMTLPAIIVTTRAALKAVPPSIREGALAMGASPWQVSLDHVLPLSLPGIMTGSILGLSRALGETAPLLMIGMVAFIADIPKGPLSASTVLPVQIYLWADSPERAFAEKSSAAILVLLGLLLGMNLLAILVRQKFSRRW